MSCKTPTPGDESAARAGHRGRRSGHRPWLICLHITDVFGMPYQIFVCVLGLVIALLSVTGVYIWWKKSRAQKFSKAHRSMATEKEEIAAE
jgi:uncharacterized iron-regulated membrane protein